MDTHLKKLALTMGVEPYSFNPYENANDDYAVLEWVNAGNLPWGSAEHITYSEWENDFCPWFKENERENPWEYKIGDYARAALKALK